jgi:P4 family phage/plasmid primase-like protien
VIEPVPTRLLEELAARRPADPPRSTRSRGGHPDIDVHAWCGVHSIAIRREKPWVNGATVFELETCVFNPDHNHGEAAIIKFASGMPLYRCLRASCVTKTWTHVRKLFGEAGTRRQTRADAQGPEQDTPATASDPDDPMRLTDVGNARRLVAEHREDLRYCKAWKSWLVWDGCRWVRDQRDQVMEYAKAITAEFFCEAAAAHDPDTQRMLVGHALRSQRAERLRAMVLLAQSEPSIPVLPAELDTDPYLLNVLNGTIELRTGALREHRHADLITKLAPVEYRPDAQLELWDRFLGEATAGCELPEGPQAAEAAQNAASLRDFLQRAAGYSLTGDTSEEVLFLVHGPEAAGKSTFVEALKATLGDYARTADFETFLAKRGDGGIRNDVARLVGARFVASIEVEEGKKLAEGLVKQLTGGDTVSARFLFAEFFEFAPAFKLWLAVNHAPRVTDQDEAIWRRILRVPFEHTVPREKRDKTLKATLKNPAVAGPAILAWAVTGCLAWQRDGLGVPPIIEAATAQYRADQDPLRDFYTQCCVFEAQAWVASASLYADYQTWARENGVRQHQILTSTAVGRQLHVHGCLPKTGEIADAIGKPKKARGWAGLRLRTEADAEADDSPPGDANDAAKANTSSTTAETNDSTDGADSPAPAATMGTAHESPDPGTRSEQEHVGTRTSGSITPTRAREDNKYEERVSTCSDLFREDCPAPRCPRCGDPAWAPPVDSGPGHCDRCGPVSCLDREPASDDGEDDGEVFE